MGWKSGAGYQITHSSLNAGSIVADPGYIDLGERGIWSGIKQGLKYATALFGNTDKVQMVKVQIPGDMAVVIATAGTALTTVTITNPTGSTTTGLGKCVSVSGPNYQPNSADGNVQIINIQLGNNADGSMSEIAGN